MEMSQEGSSTRRHHEGQVEHQTLPGEAQMQSCFILVRPFLLNCRLGGPFSVIMVTLELQRRMMERSETRRQEIVTKHG